MYLAPSLVKKKKRALLLLAWPQRGKRLCDADESGGGVLAARFGERARKCRLVSSPASSSHSPAAERALLHSAARLAPLRRIRERWRRAGGPFRRASAQVPAGQQPSEQQPLARHRVSEQVFQSVTYLRYVIILLGREELLGEHVLQGGLVRQAEAEAQVDVVHGVGRHVLRA